MGAPFTLSQLLAAQTLDEIKIQFLALLQAGGFPAITEWAGEPTGTEATFVRMVCDAIHNLAASGAPEDQRIASVAAGRFLAWAKGGWLDLLAEQLYLLEREPATKTTMTMTLTSVASAPTYQFEVGDVWLVGITGKRYQSTSGGVLAPGGSVAIDFAAEEVGSAYSDASSVLSLVTQFAGVTLSPTAGDYSTVTSGGLSSGRLQPARTDPAVVPGPHAFAVRIVVSGEVGTAIYEVSVDGGLFVSQGVLLASNVLAGGTTVAAVNGDTAPSFVAGDVFEFSTPGGTNRIQGDDAESDAHQAQRCRDRWPGLSLNVTDGKVRLWVSRALRSANRVRATPDVVTPGRFIITLADSHGALDPIGLQTVESYIRPRMSVGEGMSAVSAQEIFTYPTGHVWLPRTVSAEDAEAIKQAVDEAWVAYLGSVDIGPSQVRKSKLVDILIDAGALDVDLATLVFSAGGAIWTENVDVPDGFVPVAKPLPSFTLAWGYA